MRFQLKQIALAGLLACLGASAFATNYFYVQPKSGEMTKVSPISLTLSAATLPGATVGAPFNSTGYDFSSRLSVSGDPGFNANLATFALTSGNMPAGMALSSAGQLTGTPNAVSAGTTLQVTASYKQKTGTQSYNWISVAAASADPHIDKVSVLLHGDGVDGSSTITNNAPSAKVISVIGSTTLSGASAKFGGSSIKFPGLASAYLSMPRDESVTLGTSDFTIETWFNRTAQSTTAPSLFSNFSSWGAGALGIMAGHATNDVNRYQVYGNGVGTPLINSTATITTGVWQHIALVRIGGTLTLYVNGLNNGSANVTGINFTGVGSTVTIGMSLDSPTITYLNGYLDDYRITKGVGRYTGDFTVPTSALPN